MNKITYKSVSDYIEKVSPEIERQLNGLRKKCENGRKDGVPIYSIKTRVKKKESAYLKTKRKNINIPEEIKNNIKDYGGIRLLCLFEKEIFSINEFFILSVKKDYNFIGCKIYNWDDEPSKVFKESMLREFPGCIIEEKKNHRDTNHFTI